MPALRAVGIYLTQFGQQLTCAAYLTDHTGKATTEVKLEWPKLHPGSFETDPGTWLLQALESLSQDYDDHRITSIEVHGAAQMDGDDDAH